MESLQAIANLEDIEIDAEIVVYHYGESLDPFKVLFNIFTNKYYL